MNTMTFTKTLKRVVGSKMKKIINFCLVLGVIASIGCSGTIFTEVEEWERQKIAHKGKCTLDSNSRRGAIAHAYQSQPVIERAFEKCTSTNSNRDVVYNDTNELAKTCLDVAYSVAGAYNWIRYDNNMYSRDIFTDVKACGGK